MVTESWQVKVSDYGNESLLEEERAKRKRALYVYSSCITCIASTPVGYHIPPTGTINVLIRSCRVPEWSGRLFSLEGHDECQTFRSEHSKSDWLASCLDWM